MKKMQCEVCGSTSIKKVTDTTFECQSCGVQYSKEEAQKLLVEITGTVKIDHSNEIENALKRAAQFEQEGDFKKAEQYYQKVLDLEPENNTAKQKVEGIKKENAKPQNMYILERTISAENAFDSFLNNLRTQKNIAPDIYKEIEIISKTEEYYPFAVMHGSYSGTYSGTAVFKKEVQRMVQEEKKEFIDGKWVKVERLVPKPDFIDDPKPASGNFSVKCKEIASLSNALATVVRVKCADKCNEKNDFFATIENYIDNCYGTIASLMVPLVIGDPSIDLPIKDESIGENMKKRAFSLYNTRVSNACYNAACECIGGYKQKNVKTHNVRTDHQAIDFVYIPIQVVEYAYKGDFYISTIVLVDDCKRNNLTYPYYNKIDAVEEEGNQEVAETSHKGMYGFFAWLMAALTGFLGWWTSSAGGLFPDICNAIAICCVFLGALQTTLGVIKLIQANKIRNEYINKLDRLSRAKDAELKKEFELFFNNYKGIESIENCTEIIRKNSAFSCNDEEISCRASSDYFDDDFETDEDEEDYTDNDE